jgi:hypothetical protein
MLIHDGEQRFLGDPEEAALGYYRLNFGGTRPVRDDREQPGAVPDVNVRLIDVWLEDEEGRRADNLEQGRPFSLNLVVEARRELSAPVFDFHCVNLDGEWVFAFSKALQGQAGEPQRVARGERLRLVAQLENPLLPGRYAIDCWISRNREEGDMAIHVLRLLDFFVYGTRPGAGNVSVNAEVEALLEHAGAG